MFSKLRTLTAVCSVAVLAISAATLACPNDKQVSASVKSHCGSQKTAAVQVANVGQKQCSKSRQASTIAVASKKEVAPSARPPPTQDGSLKNAPHARRSSEQ